MIQKQLTEFFLSLWINYLLLSGQDSRKLVHIQNEERKAASEHNLTVVVTDFRGIPNLDKQD